MRRKEIWFWQRIISPHMVGLASALARRGHGVTYVAERPLSPSRAAQGWETPSLDGVTADLAETPSAMRDAVNDAPPDSIHLCQGLRGNGLISVAQKNLSRRGLRQWVMMETVNDAGFQGVLKRVAYRRHFASAGRSLEGVLATGHSTPDWVVAQGMPRARVFPFAYFLPEVRVTGASREGDARSFRFIFVGQFIERKRLDLLLSALACVMDEEWEFVVVGSGPLETALRGRAERELGDRVRWIGILPMAEVKHEMAQADCLVLPSRFDGWGAVVSEALMVGTPVIASDRCGSAGVVGASKRGGVFKSGSLESLVGQLQSALDRGTVHRRERETLAEWGRCLASDAGALYVSQILDHVEGNAARPVPPWHQHLFQ